MIKTFQGVAPTQEKGVWVADSARVIGRVTLQEDANVWYGAVIRGDVEQITIGKRTNIQDNATIHADAGDPTIIGDDVTVGHGAIVHGCRIESCSLIGMGAIILNNAVIGTESLVGAGAVVPPGKTYPPRSLILGSPAKVVRTITDEEVAMFKVSAAHYVENARQHQTSETVE